MKSISFTLVRLAAVALAILGLASCSSYKPPLRIALIRWPPFEFMHLAQEKGFFAEEGIEVRLIEFVAVNDTRRAFEHDKIDGGMFSIFQVLLNRDLLGRKMQVPMVIDFSNGADAIMARPGIKDIRGLRGQRIGVTLSPLDYYFLSRAFGMNGMSLNDVSLVYVRMEDAAEALRSGRVAAVTCYPPDSTAIEAAGLAHTIFSSKQIPGEIVDVLAIDEAIVRDRPKDVAALIRAFYRALRFAQEHPDDAWRIMAERERITPAEFKNALDAGITLVPLADQQRFLGKNSTLHPVADRITQLLRERDQLTEPAHETELLNSEPAALAGSP